MLKSWLELNALVSSDPISVAFSTHLKCKMISIHADIVAPEIIRRIPYALHRYALRHLVSYYIKQADKVFNIYLVSSSEEPITYLIEELKRRKIIVSEEKYLNEQEVQRLIQKHMHVLAESYIRLALRSYLLHKGYFMRTVGSRILWSKGDSSYLYVVDVDVDPRTLEGYISVDFKLYSSSSIWDKIVDGSLSMETLQELKDSLVLVPYGRKYAYGRIVGFIEKKVSEDIEIEDNKINLLKYYAEEKHIELNPDEYPIVVIKLISPERDKPLLYPPSQVRLLISDKRPEPRTRYEEIDKVLKDISSGFKLYGISFKRVPIRMKGYVNMIKDIKLRYYGGVESHRSPLISVQQDNVTPLRGKIDIPVLITLLPKRLYERENEIKVTTKLVQELFKAYNMGEIRNVRIEYYNDELPIDELKVELSRAIGSLTSIYSPEEAVIVPVIGHRELFSVVKQRCSERYFHARVVEESTLVKILDAVAEYLLKSPYEDLDKLVEKFVSGLKEQGLQTEEDEQFRQFISKLSNIVFSIYIEFIIQSEVSNNRIPRMLTWSLAEPADGEGRTLYLGYDVSRGPHSRGEVAATFLLYDSYGNMINAAVKRYSGERLSRELLENVLLSLIAYDIKKQHVNRLVIYKDGVIRSIDEGRELLEVLQSIGTKVGFKEFDIIGVVKRHNIRLFRKEIVKTGIESLKITNPRRGTWAKLWNVSRHGIVAERALVVSSEVRAGGTVKPVVIERYNIVRSGKEIEDIVYEYLRLCRLDFWNPLDGINKYPLPVFMADKLAYLSLIGVEIRTP